MIDGAALVGKRPKRSVQLPLFPDSQYPFTMTCKMQVFSKLPLGILPSIVSKGNYINDKEKNKKVKLLIYNVPC
jgi:hypothetical protein